MCFLKTIQWPRHTVVALALLVTVVFLGCREDTKAECEDEPLGSLTIWAENVDAFEPVRFAGTVQAISPASDDFQRISIIGDDAKEWALVFRLPGTTLPVVVNGHYDFEVQYAGGWPAASSVFISDENGFLFAGVSDWEVGANVAKNGIPGFQIEKTPTDCPSRPHGSCYDMLTNALLTVSTDDNKISLYHSTSSLLGSYEVMCLTCQDVGYNSSCADAGLIGVSYTIVRVSPAK